MIEAGDIARLPCADWNEMGDMARGEEMGEAIGEERLEKRPPRSLGVRGVTGDVDRARSLFLGLPKKNAVKDGRLSGFLPFPLLKLNSATEPGISGERERLRSRTPILPAAAVGVPVNLNKE